MKDNNEISLTEELDPNKLAASEVNISEILSEISLIDSQIQKTKENGELAKEKANNVKAGLFMQKHNIDELKDVSIMNADANIKTLEIVGKVSENQTKMASACHALLAIGAVSIAQNRAIVSSIEAKLRQGEDKELSEETKKRLIEVIQELKRKQDFLERQERQGTKINELNRRVIDMEKELSEAKKQVAEFYTKQSNLRLWLRLSIAIGLIAIVIGIVNIII